MLTTRAGATTPDRLDRLQGRRGRIVRRPGNGPAWTMDRPAGIVSPCVLLLRLAKALGNVLIHD